MRVVLALPVLNPGPQVRELVAALRAQTLQPDEIIVVDSSSTDGYVEAFRELGATIHVISRAQFDHGGTRNLALQLARADIYVYLTQDAIPDDEHALARIVDALVSNPDAGMAYGRQLPHRGAGIFGTHARLFNYPPQSRVQTLGRVPELGVKAAFCSNSFAAYRREALEAVGYFPQRVIFGEDTVVAARMLQQGREVRYVADACVRHSHDYTLREEFSRYFDAGVFHSTERWYGQLLGSAGGEGLRFVRAEVAFARRAAGVAAIVPAIVRNGVRWTGYQLGRRFRIVPAPLRPRLGMNRGYWRRRDEQRAA